MGSIGSYIENINEEAAADLERISFNNDSLVMSDKKPKASSPEFPSRENS